MMHFHVPRMLPPPPARLVREGDFYGSQRENRARYSRYQLKIQCLMLIDKDRRCGLNLRVMYD